MSLNMTLLLKRSFSFIYNCRLATKLQNFLIAAYNTNTIQYSLLKTCTVVMLRSIA